MPLALDQKVGTVVWSPLGWGRLTGKIRRGQPLPETSRLQKQGLSPDMGPQVADEYLFRSSTRSTRSRRRPARPCRRSRSTGCCSGRRVASVIIGARNEEQLQAEPRRRRLESDARAGRQARRRQRQAAGVSVLASGAIQRAKSAARRLGQGRMIEIRGGGTVRSANGRSHANADI